MACWFGFILIIIKQNPWYKDQELSSYLDEHCHDYFYYTTLFWSFKLRECILRLSSLLQLWITLPIYQNPKPPRLRIVPRRRLHRLSDQILKIWFGRRFHAQTPFWFRVMRLLYIILAGLNYCLLLCRVGSWYNWSAGNFSFLNQTSNNTIFYNNYELEK